MILFPIQPSNLLVTSKVHLVYFISFYLANIFPWMPGASRTHQSHINRLMAHSAWSLDGANPGAQDPCLRCSLQTHLHYKKHYTLYTSFMRTYLSHNRIYIYIFIYIHIYIQKIYQKSIFQSPVCCFIAATFASSTAFVPKKHANIDIPAPWIHLKDSINTCFTFMIKGVSKIHQDPGGRTRSVWWDTKNIIWFSRKNTMENTGGGVDGSNPFSVFLVVFEGKGRHVMSCCAAWWKKYGSMTSGSKDQFGILPSWSSIKNPSIQQESLANPGIFGVLSNHPKKPNQCQKECPPQLVGGFNPSEKYSSKWESSPIFGVKIIQIFETTT